MRNQFQLSPFSFKQFYFWLPLAWLWFVLINDLRVEWTVNPQYSYGWAVPFLCAFLLWQRIQGDHHRSLTTDHRLPTPEAASFILFLLFALLAVLYAPTRLVEEANPGWRLVSWALAIEVVGSTLIFIRLALGSNSPAPEDRGQETVGGKQCSVFCPPFSAFVFPICFFLVAVPWPTPIEGLVIQGLTRVDAAFTTELLGWFGIPAVPHGNVIEVATGMVGIDEACSGIRSFQATLMISLFLGEFYALGRSRRVFCVFAGFALSFLFNLARMSLLVWVAARKGVAAIAAWHDPAGVTILVACFLSLWALGAILRGKRERPNRSIEEQKLGGGNPKPDNETKSREQKPGSKNEFQPFAFRTSALLMAGWILLTECSVEAWYRSHEARLPLSAQWTIAWPVNNPTYKELPLPARTVEILRYDEGRSAAWEEGGLKWQAVFLRWKPGRTAIHLAQNHTPEICMTGAGYKLDAISPQEWFDVNGLQMPFLAYRVTNAPQPFFVFYCLWNDRASVQGFETMGLVFDTRIPPVLAGLRNPGQRSLEIALAGPDNAAEAEADLRAELEKLVVSKP